VFDDEGETEGWEEYYDYIFPDEQAAKPNLKLLASAKMWKQKRQEMLDAAAAKKEAAEDGNADGSVEPEDGEDGEADTATSTTSFSGKSASSAVAMAAAVGDTPLFDFDPADSFTGSRPGFAFKMGDQGLGYYADV
jgi:hypothetical protein